MANAFDDIKSNAFDDLPQKEAPNAFDDIKPDAFNNTEPEPSPFTSTLKSTGASLLNSFAGQPIEDIGNAVGSKELANVGSGIRRYAEGVQHDNPSTINSLSDVVEHPVDAVKTALGNVLPQIPVSMAGAYAGAELGALTSPVTGPVGPIVGGLAGLFLPSYAQEYTEMRGKQHESGQEDIPKALAYAVPSAASDVVLDKVLLGGSKFLPSSLRNAAADTLAPGANRAVHALKQGAKGFAAEAGQEYGQTYLEQLGGNQDTSTEQAANERNVSAALGGIGGGIVKGGLSVTDQRAVDPNTPPAPEPSVEQSEPATDERLKRYADNWNARIAAGKPAPSYTPAFIDALTAAGIEHDPNIPAAEAFAKLDAVVNPKAPVDTVTEQQQAALDSAPVKGIFNRAATAANEAGITPAQQAAAELPNGGAEVSNKAAIAPDAGTTPEQPNVADYTSLTPEQQHYVATGLPPAKEPKKAGKKQIDFAAKTMSGIADSLSRSGAAGMPSITAALRQSAVGLGVYDPAHTPDQMAEAVNTKLKELTPNDQSTNATPQENEEQEKTLDETEDTNRASGADAASVAPAGAGDTGTESTIPETPIDDVLANEHPLLDSNTKVASADHADNKAAVNYNGLSIDVENPKGSIREGKAPATWKQEMQDHYGEIITGKEGADGDKVDVFIPAGLTREQVDNPNQTVYIIDQVDKDGHFDEHKVVLGANSAQEAGSIYNRNYEAGWDRGAKVTPMSLPDFKTWLKTEGTKAPVDPNIPIKATAETSESKTGTGGLDGRATTGGDAAPANPNQDGPVVSEAGGERVPQVAQPTKVKTGVELRTVNGTTVKGDRYLFPGNERHPVIISKPTGNKGAATKQNHTAWDEVSGAGLYSEPAKARGEKPSAQHVIDVVSGQFKAGLGGKLDTHESRKKAAPLAMDAKEIARKTLLAHVQSGDLNALRGTQYAPIRAQLIQQLLGLAKPPALKGATNAALREVFYEQAGIKADTSAGMDSAFRAWVGGSPESAITGERTPAHNQRVADMKGELKFKAEARARAEFTERHKGKPFAQALINNDFEKASDDAVRGYVTTQDAKAIFEDAQATGLLNDLTMKNVGATLAQAAESEYEVKQRDMGSIIAHVFNSIKGGNHYVNAGSNGRTKYITESDFEKRTDSANKELGLAKKVLPSDILTDGIVNGAYTGGVGSVQKVTGLGKYPASTKGQPRNIRITVDPSVAEAPTSEAPTSEAPTSEAPTSEAPTSEAPTSEAPTAEKLKSGTHLSKSIDLFAKLQSGWNKDHFASNIAYSLNNTNKAMITDGEHFYDLFNGKGSKSKVMPNGQPENFSTKFEGFDRKLKTGMQDGSLSYNAKAKAYYDSLMANEAKIEQLRKDKEDAAKNAEDSARKEAEITKEQIEANLVVTKFTNGTAEVLVSNLKDPVVVKGKMYKGLVVARDVTPEKGKGAWAVYVVSKHVNASRYLNTQHDAMVAAMRIGDALADFEPFERGSLSTVRPELGYSPAEVARAIREDGIYANVYQFLGREAPAAKLSTETPKLLAATEPTERGMPVAEAEAMLPPRAKGMLKTSKLIIVQHGAELQKILRKADPTVHIAGAEGLYNPNTDTVYLVADVLSKDSLISVLSHELYHRAEATDLKLQEAMNRFDVDLMNRFALAKNGKGAPEELAAFQRVIESGTPKADQLEEFRAYLVTGYTTAPTTFTGMIRRILDDFIAAMRVALARAGLDLGLVRSLTPADLFAMSKYGTHTTGQAASSKVLASARGQGYEGENTGEAAEWLRAKAKGLDMSKEARMARAEAMGFDTGKVWYHGSPNAGFKEMYVKNVGAFFTDRYDVAASYAGSYDEVDESNLAGDGEQQAVYSVYLKPGNSVTLDWGGKDWGDGVDGLKTDEAANRAKYEGADSVTFENVTDVGWLAPGFVDDDGVGSVAVVFRPDQARSIFAAFDPDFKDSGNLLASKPASSLNAVQYAQVQTPEFKAWFGDSEVVDENGDPALMYHGSAEDIESFKGFANWFSESPKFASEYADMRDYAKGGGGNVTQAFIKAERPFDADRLTKGANTVAAFVMEMAQQARYNGTAFSVEEANKLLDVVRASAREEESGPHYAPHQFWMENHYAFGRKGSAAIADLFKLFGFDSIRFTEDGEPTIGVLSPNQVKSAIGNNGQFSAGSNDIRYSRTARGILDELTQNGLDDNMFRHPISEETTLKGVFADVAPEFKPTRDFTLPGFVSTTFESPDGKKVMVHERDDKVWIDVANLVSGDRGSAIYAAVGNYAENSGKTFVGDPNGLSETAVIRRTNAMLSLAVRFGFTDFMEPAAEQLAGIPEKGVPPLKWGTDAVDNLNSLIDTVVSTVEHYVPEIKDYYYDFDSEQFKDGDGTVLSDLWSERARVSRGAGASKTGERTLREVVVLKSVVSKEGRERSRILEHIRSGGLEYLPHKGLDKLFSRGGRPEATFATPQEAVEHLTAQFGPGVSRLVDTGVLNFSHGKGGWPYGYQGDEEAIYVNGKATIDLDATDRSRLSSVLLHEIGEHFNLKRMIGTPAYSALQQRIRQQATVKGSQAAKTWAQVAKAYPDLEVGSEGFVSEVIAKLGEKNPNLPWYKRLVVQLKAFLMKHGLARGFIAGTMTADDIHALLVSSLHSAARGRAMGKASYYNEAVQASILGWHGSPHDHNGFDSSKIGTGEGAQTFGYGHYFTDSKDIAEYYRNNLSRSELKLNGKQLISRDSMYDRHWIVDEDLEKAIPDEFVDKGNLATGRPAKKLKPELAEAFNDIADLEKIGRFEVEDNFSSEPLMSSFGAWLKNYELEVVKGRLYEVELAPEPNEFLDWDKPLSEQSNKVRSNFGFDSKIADEYNTRYASLLAKYGGSRMKLSAQASTEEKTNLRDLGVKAGVIPEGSPSLVGMDGQGYYRQLSKELGSDKAASTYLHALGIRGIRYKADGGKSEANNYVTFDDKDINISAKYSRPTETTTVPAETNLWDNIKDGADEWADKVMSQRWAFLSVQQMVDRTKKYLPQAKSYESAMRARRIVMEDWYRRSDRVTAVWKKLANAMKVALGNTMQDSTLSDVDASLPWRGIATTERFGMPDRYYVHSQAKFTPTHRDTLTNLATALGAVEQTAFNKGATFDSLEAAKSFEEALRTEEEKQTRFRENGEYVDENLERAAQHATLREEFNGLTDEARGVYTATNKLHNRLSEAKFKTLVDRITTSVMDGNKRAALIADLRLRKESAALSWYYAPLQRFGDYWFYGKDADGNAYFSKFKTARQRDRARDAFQKENGTETFPGKTIKELMDTMDSSISDSFMLDIQAKIAATGLPTEQVRALQDDVYQMYLENLPDVSMRHSSQHRKNTLGFTKDAMQAFAFHIHHGASQLANMKEGRLMDHIIQAMKETVAMANETWTSGTNTAELRAANEAKAAETLAENWAEWSRPFVLETKLAADPDNKLLKEMLSSRNKFAPVEEHGIATARDQTVDIEKALLKYADSIRDTIGYSKLLAKESDRQKAAEVVGELASTYRAMVNMDSSTMDHLAGTARQFGFIWMLGFGLSSGMMNLFQTPVVAMPVVAGKYGVAKTVAAFNVTYGQFMKAIRMALAGDLDEDGNASISVVLKAELAKLTEGSAEYEKVEGQLKALEHFKRTGATSRTQAQDVIGISKNGDVEGGKMQALIQKMGWMFHHGERVNREVTLMAAYNLAMSEAVPRHVPGVGMVDSVLEHREAIDYAQSATNLGHGDYAAENAARVFRGWPSGIALQFGKYPQLMYYVYGATFADANNGWKKMPAGEAREAAKQEAREAGRTLTALLTMQWAVAGTFGLPLTGALFVALNAIAGALDDDDDPWDTKREMRRGLYELGEDLAPGFGETLATAVTKGLLNAFTPADFGGRMGIANIKFQEQKKELEGRDAATSILVSLFGPTGGLVQRLFEGVKLAGEGEYERAAEQVLPKFLGDPLKAGRFATQDARSLNGKKLKDMGPQEYLLQMVGIGSSDLSNKYDDQGYEMAAKDAIDAARIKLLHEAARAKTEHEPVPAAELRDWNRKYPDNPIHPEDVYRSIRASKREETKRGDKGYYVPDYVPDYAISDDED